MPLKTYAFAAAIATTFVALPVLAEEITVPAGRTSTIYQFGNINESCQASGRPVPHVLTAPGHGKIDFRWVAGSLGKNAGRCAGKTTKVVQVIYTPERGFHGKDHIKIGFSTNKFDDSGNSFYSSSSDIVVR